MFFVIFENQSSPKMMITLPDFKIDQTRTISLKKCIDDLYTGINYEQRILNTKKNMCKKKCCTYAHSTTRTYVISQISNILSMLRAYFVQYMHVSGAAFVWNPPFSRPPVQFKICIEKTQVLHFLNKSIFDIFALFWIQ